MENSRYFPNDIKKIFWKKGACSHASFFLLNREFSNTKGNEERASDHLSGGLLQTGHQCGMLWGTSLATGAQSYRKHNNNDQAIYISILTTQKIMESFSKRAKTHNCRDITGCNLSSISGLLKLTLTTFIGGFNNSKCAILMEKWIPEAIETANISFSKENKLPKATLSCASEVARKMGSSEEEMVMVSGFAGGMGLSGNACGALAAAVWLKMLEWCKLHPGKTPAYFNNPETKKLLKTFYSITDSKILCNKICGRQFNSIEEHTEYIRSGGCEKLINALANL